MVRKLGLLVLAAAVSMQASAQGALTIPPPRGLLSDFAGVISAERAGQIEALSQYVRDRSGGEIAIVTLPDLGGREVGDVALQIGREWKVGAKAAIGDARRNAGVVVLLVPKETSADGRGYISIQTGNGVEGFVPDAVAGDIRREATPALQRRDYGAALYLITARLAERYAAEFKFSLDSAGVTLSRGRGRARQSDDGGGVSPFIALIVFIFLILLFSRGGRGGCASFLVGQAIGQAMGSRGRWGGGGFGGGGGGGGGFGGFGGGGGFSGGGSSGSF